MICTRVWAFERAEHDRCQSCSERLIPYIPSCRACGAASPRALQVRELTERSLQKPPGAVRIGHLSDLHVGQPGSASPIEPLSWFRIWLERFRAREVDVVVVSGDLVHRPADRAGLLGCYSALQAAQMPYVVVPGNHDISRPGYREVFHELFGRYPRVEEHCGVAFMLFDSMAGLPMEERDIAEKMYGDVICYTEGRVGREQLEAAELLMKTIAPSQRRMLVLHHHLARQHPDPMIQAPILDMLDEDMFDTMKTLHDAEVVCRWAARHDVEVVFHGHKHLFQQPGVRQGQLVVLNGGSSTLKPRKRARLIDLVGEREIRVINVELRR